MATTNENRFSAITPDDHAGSIWIASILCLIYSTLVLVLRGYLRKMNYGIDDYLAAAATITQMGEVTAIMIGLKRGLGRSQILLQQHEISAYSRATFVGEVLFILALCLAKCSTISLMMRLFNLSGPKAQQHNRSRVIYRLSCGMLGLMAAWGILSIVALSVDCSSTNFVHASSNAQCPKQLIRWQLITAIDVATEALLVFLSALTVLPVHLTSELKFQIVVAFAFRLPLIALSLLHLHYVSSFVESSKPGIAIATVIVLQQVQLCWSLISATIPNLKAFVKSFNSGFGLGIDVRTYAYGSGRACYELGSVQASNMMSTRGNKSYNEIEENQAANEMPTQDEIKQHPEDISPINSRGSQEHIIRKDVQWKVYYENDAARPGEN